MKALMNLMMTLCLPFLLMSMAMKTPVVDHSELEYCNDRYKFCIDYPNDLFTGKMLADNGDGITLYEDTKNIEVKVFGAYNVMDWSLEDIYYFSFEDFTQNGQEVINLERNFEEYSFETTFLVENQLHYYRTYLLDDIYVSISIILPEKEMEMLNNLKEKVQFSVNI